MGTKRRGENMKIDKFIYFYPEKPKLIHKDQGLFNEVNESDSWVAERKYNGSRLQLHCLNGKFGFWNRHNAEFNYIPSKETLNALRAGIPDKGYFLFDGELRDRKVKGVRDQIMLYDVFIWKNELLVGNPFWYRRNFLEHCFKANDRPVGITEQFKGDFKKTFEQVIKDEEIEGLVLKNTRGILDLGRTGAKNSGWMLKVRRPNGSYRF